MPMESRVSVSDTPPSKRSEATEQVVEDVEMADNLSVDSDGSLVPSKSLTTVKPGVNQVSTGKKTEVIGESNAGVGLTARQIKRRRQKARQAEALAKARTQAPSTSTPVTETGKRGRTEDSSVALRSSGNETGSVPTTGKRRKAKKRKVEKRNSEMPASSTPSKADKPLPDKAEAKGPQMSNDTLPSTSGESFARMAAKAMTVEIHTDKQDGLLSKGQQDYLDSYLWKAIGESKDAPTFEGKSVVDGIVKVHCSNAFSREWLEKAIAKIPACENSKFILVESSKERLVRASVWIPGPSCNSAELLKRIRVQNKDLDTTLWRVYSCTRPVV
ncbi:uncharacterized protein LOC128871822 [Anastrepha ludens]|uniref:uncharacterized protein LOC128871822 n=1 Tax=Anastrepha ludens TaxID=28586 RepID=UPI0023B1A93A|nr:uncharacterized protein LOC128871822 [Anastrepha ludens]